MHTWGTPLKQVQKGKASSEQNHKEIIGFLKRLNPRAEHQVPLQVERMRKGSSQARGRRIDQARMMGQV